MIAMDLNKQKALDTDSKAVHQITLLVSSTISGSSQGTARVL